MAGRRVLLTASDGFELSAYRSDANSAKGCIVVLQEIFGVNHFIRAFCDRMATEGYTAIAPALFDRQQRDFESGYSPEEVQAARRFVASPDLEAMRRDADAARDAVSAIGPVAVLGFCLGGSVAFACATRSQGYAAAIGYYGGMIVRLLDEVPLCPTMLHFGETDHTIPLSDVASIKAHRPDVVVHTYAAGHGFACDERASFKAVSADLAWRRTREMLDTAFAA